MDFYSEWIVPSQFMPHGHCYLWTPALLWMYVISDSLIFLSYYTIPLALLTFVKRRRDLQFNWIFVMFSLFIFACGTTHAISIITIWHPAYWIDASAKVLTALFSTVTAVMLWRLMPVALQVPSTKQLSDTVSKLETEIQQRLLAETALAQVNMSLESLVRERTVELTNANQLLRQEIEQKKEIERALFAEKQQALVTLESIGDAVITSNMQSKVTYLNPIAEKMTGWTKNDAVGKPLLEVFHILNESTRELETSFVDLSLTARNVSGLDVLLVGKDGAEFSIEYSASPIRDSDGTILGVVQAFHDVSNAKRKAHEMTYLAEHDFLTGLPNRLLLEDRINQAVSAAKRRNGKTAMMFLDIDHFKNINDTLGHAVGDQLLVQVSKTLQTCLRGSDTLSRQGGDEFVILLPDIADSDAAVEVAEKLIATTKSSLIIGTDELHISFSIGVAIYPEDGATADLLTKSADTAMYHAKRAGRDNYQLFSAEMTQRINS
jgi:diguanylate cyclase (GGDEF)-like protein/PAS domain S-box-containing protein